MLRNFFESLSLALSSSLLSGGLLCLHFLQSGISGGCSDTALLRGSLSDVFQGSTNNGSLNLVGTTSSLLGCGLRKSLLVKTSPCLSPNKLGSLFSLDSQAVGLRSSEPDWLSVTTDHKLTISRVNSVL